MHEEKDGHINISKQSTVDKPLINSHIELRDYDRNSTDTKDDIGPLNHFCIVISKATAKWIKNQTNNSLENISVAIQPGSLVAIVGPVGAGKVCDILIYFKRFFMKWPL